LSVTIVRRWGKEEGSALIEFLLASIFLIFPLLLGTIVFGLSLVRANQVAEVCRDAGHIYAYGVVDFSLPSSQNMLVQLSQGLNMTTSGGNGVIILSTVTLVGADDCRAGGFPSGDCRNLDKAVFTRRIVVGNSQLHGSAFGDPAGIVGSGGNIQPADYAASASALAGNFSNVIPLTVGQFAYVAEAFFVSPDLNFWGGNSYWSWISPGGISARSIF
jgi:hypothetical protein